LCICALNEMSFCITTTTMNFDKRHSLWFRLSDSEQL
jgi:hypothetical protein